MGEEEGVIKKWVNIAKYTPYDKQTLRKKYGKDMLEKGFVFKDTIGRGRNEKIWSYKWLIMKYFVLINQEKQQRLK